MFDNNNGNKHFSMQNILSNPLAYSVLLIVVLVLLGKAHCFTSVNLIFGYRQIALNESNKEEAIKIYVNLTLCLLARSLPLGCYN